MNTQTTLHDLGLSDHESLIYLTILKLGGSTASVIAKAAGLKRTSVYALLHGLAQKGFIAMYYRKNKQLYYAERPERISRYFEKKLDAFEQLIPTLESFDKTQAKQFGLRFIETLPELKKFYNEILDEYQNKTYHIVSSGEEWEGLDPEWFVEFRKERGRRHIKTKLLLSPHFKKHNPTNPKLLRDWKFLPAGHNFKSTIDIYKDKILIVSPELTSLAVVIAVPAMTDVFKVMFEMLWESLK